MESNTNDTYGSQHSGSSGTVGSGMSGSSATSGSDAGFLRDSGSEAQGLADRAKSAAGSAGDKLSDVAERAKSAAGSAGDKLSEVGSSVRDKAGTFKDSLADALQSGAERLRQQGAQGSGMAADGSTSLVAEDNRIAQTSNQIAGGMQGAAEWLRDADLDGLKTGLEKQVKEHPGRTLAVAVGIGYLLGKAFRK